MAGGSSKPLPSLNGSFPGVDVSKTSATRSSYQQTTAMSMKDSLHRSLLNGQGWPAWATSAKDGRPVQTGFTLCLVDYVRARFNSHQLQKDPFTIVQGVKRASTSKGAKIFSEIWQRIEDEACEVIFGSNFIENAGAGLDYTLVLCKKIFRGEHVDAAAIEPHSPDYNKLLADFKHRGKPFHMPEAIRTRREIIQHAQALSWAVDTIVLS